MSEDSKIKLNTMYVKFDYNFDCYFYSNNKKDLEYIDFSFTDRNVTAGIKGISTKEISEQDEGKSKKYYLLVEKLSFAIKYDTFSITYDEILKHEEKKRELYIHLVRIVNRIMRALRNFSYSPSIHEINVDIADFKHYLWRWDVSISKDGASWDRLTNAGALEGLFQYMKYPEHPFIDLSSLRDIDEAIKLNIRPTPDQEFIVNTIEYIRENNYRLAILEIIISLEIVITEYYRRLFEKKEYSKEHLNSLVGPNMPLYNKILLLKSFLEKDQMGSISVPSDGTC